MAVPSYTTDLNDITLANSGGTWSELTNMTAGGTPTAAETDFFIQGTGCTSASNNNKTGLQSIAFDYGSSLYSSMNVSGYCLFLWQVDFPSNAMDNGAPARGRLGLRVRPVSPGEAGDPESARGLVVEEASGPAAEAGIQPGDVVLSANGRPVRNVEDLRAIVKHAKDLVALLAQRGSSRIFVPVELA